MSHRIRAQIKNVSLILKVRETTIEGIFPLAGAQIYTV